MTLGTYLWGMGVGTFFVLIGWLSVVLYVDPEESGIIGTLLFYGSTFLLFSGLAASFLGWLGKKSAKGNEDESVAHIATSFRQGILLALLLVILLFFQEKGILTWWDGLLAVAGIFLIELYFLSHRK